MKPIPDEIPAEATTQCGTLAQNSAGKRALTLSPRRGRRPAGFRQRPPSRLCPSKILVLVSGLRAAERSALLWRQVSRTTQSVLCWPQVLRALHGGAPRSLWRQE
jgi:hypothetical protein